MDWILYKASWIRVKLIIMVMKQKSDRERGDWIEAGKDCLDRVKFD